MNTPAQAPTVTPSKGVRPQLDGASTPTTQLRQCVVLDTSVLMADATAHLSYPNTDVVIPLTVIDELDRNKSRADAAGRNARHFLNELESLRSAQGGLISDWFDLPDNSQIRIEPNGVHLDELAEFHLAEDTPDHRILASARSLARERPTGVKVISNDTALRVKAVIIGLDAAQHTPGRIGVHAPNRRGYHEITLSSEAINALHGSSRVVVADLPWADQEALAGVFDNEFIWVTGTAVSARYVAGQLQRVRRSRPWRARARNREQEFALDLLADDAIKLVALRGHAGTGKSLLAIAAGLEAVIRQRTHDQLLILRPMISVGRQDLGFLPGDIAEKTQPWFEAVVDVLIALSDQDKQGKRLTYKEAKTLLAELIEEGKVALAPVTFLRGRTFHNTFAILDESQNLDPSTVKTVISRLGNNSRLILTGDDGQIDVPFASSLTCGLNVAVDAFAGEPVFGQVFFTKGERSALADLAAERM